MELPTWREATERALYREGGFFHRESPAAHFRTSAHAAPDLLAGALVRLARDSNLTMIVDIGAGGGELLTALASLAPDLDLAGIDLADRPTGLPDHVQWSATLPGRLDRTLVFANEWLDNVAVDVAEVDERGDVRRVHVDPATGEELLGDRLHGADRLWQEAWWPLHDAEEGTRAEIGHPRDAAWSEVVRRLEEGLAVAVDYAHCRRDRPAAGTLVGYSHGRMVRPIPDGSCDLTTHVALDACAAAGIAAGADATLLITQRDALQRLGLDASLPSRHLATHDPTAYLSALNAATRAAELLSPAGLGGFGWLVQAKGVELPSSLRGAGRLTHPGE